LGWEAVSLSENFGMISGVFEREFPDVAIDHSLKRKNQSSLSLVVEDSSFWDVKLCLWVNIPQLFERSHRLQLQSNASLSCTALPKDEGAVIPQKADKFRVLIRHPTQKTWTCFGKTKLFIGLRFGNGIGKVELFSDNCACSKYVCTPTILTPRNRIISGRLISAYQAKKFPPYSGNHQFIVLYTLPKKPVEWIFCPSCSVLAFLGLSR
jgi:hypothetical protein